MIDAVAQPIVIVDDGIEPASLDDVDPGVVVLTCANCGAAMDERKCKLICLSATGTNRLAW
jgi:hypothetical protein